MVHLLTAQMIDIGMDVGLYDPHSDVLHQNVQNI